MHNFYNPEKRNDACFQTHAGFLSRLLAYTCGDFNSPLFLRWWWDKTSRETKEEKSRMKGTNSSGKHIVGMQQWVEGRLLLAQGFPSGSVGEAFACNAGDLGSIPG